MKQEQKTPTPLEIIKKRAAIMRLDTLPKGKAKLVGENGNSFAVVARATRGLQKAGWKQPDIDLFTEICFSGDRNHLLRTVLKFVDDTYRGCACGCGWPDGAGCAKDAENYEEDYY